MTRVLRQIILFNKYSKKTRCVGGRHSSEWINQNVFEKLNLKTQQLFKIIMAICSTCGRIKYKNFYRKK